MSDAVYRQLTYPIEAFFDRIQHLDLDPGSNLPADPPPMPADAGGGIASDAPLYSPDLNFHAAPPANFNPFAGSFAAFHHCCSPKRWPRRRR
jgi:hypothetical protein